jgi:cytochrome c-type biogenesis protein CcmE
VRVEAYSCRSKETIPGNFTCYHFFNALVIKIIQVLHAKRQICNNFAVHFKNMKKLHIIILVLIAASIAVLISFMGSLTTYDTVETAKNKQGKFVHLVAKLDTRQPVEYDAINNPNYLSFTAIDSLGGSVKVVYNNAKPENFEHSTRLVLKGSMQQNHFECREILMKCPSKYKDDQEAAKKNIPVAASVSNSATKNN